VAVAAALMSPVRLRRLSILAWHRLIVSHAVGQ